MSDGNAEAHACICITDVKADDGYGISIWTSTVAQSLREYESLRYISDCQESAQINASKIISHSMPIIWVSKNPFRINLRPERLRVAVCTYKIITYFWTRKILVVIFLNLDSYEKIGVQYG